MVTDSILGGGEGDAVIDAHTLFNKLSEIDDDMSVVNKSAHFLGQHKTYNIYIFLYFLFRGSLKKNTTNCGIVLNLSFEQIVAMVILCRLCLNYVL